MNYLVLIGFNFSCVTSYLIVMSQAIAICLILGCSLEDHCLT